MKLSNFITMILVIGLSFALVGAIITDLETNYPEVDINSTWEDDYDYTEEINKSTYGLKTRFDDIGDEDAGWWTRITAGITAIPLAVIFVPSIIIKTLIYSVEIFTNIAKAVGIPPFVVVFGIVAILVIMMFGLIAFWHRSKI